MAVTITALNKQVFLLLGKPLIMLNAINFSESFLVADAIDVDSISISIFL